MEVAFVVCGYCGANAKVEGNKCLQRTDCEGTGLADDDVVSLSINHGRGPLLRWHDGDKDPNARRHKDHWDVVDKKAKRHDEIRVPERISAMLSTRKEMRLKNRQRSASLMWSSAWGQPLPWW